MENIKKCPKCGFAELEVRKVSEIRDIPENDIMFSNLPWCRCLNCGLRFPIYEKREGRISWDDYFMNMAILASSRSTCIRRSIGAVAVLGTRVLCTAYNGAPSGMRHCIDSKCLRDEQNIESGTRHEKCLHGDTVIKLLDGTYKTISELFEIGEDQWVYSINTKTGELKPALASNIRITGKRDDLVRIILDNGESFKVTQDHLVMLRDCSFKKAGELSKNDSLMPMYYRIEKNNQSSGKYEIISNTIHTRSEGMSTTWKDNYAGRTNQIPTHVWVHQCVYGSIPEGHLVHHINENSLNNIPSNIKSMLIGDHTSLHNTFDTGHYVKMQKASTKSRLKNNPESFSQNGRKNMKANWDNPEFRRKASIRSKELAKKLAAHSNSNERHILLRKKGRILAGLSLLLSKFKGKINSDNYEKLREKFKTKGRGGVPIPTIKTILSVFPSLSIALEEAKEHNHKVVQVEKIKGTHTVYDISVPKFENFAIEVGGSCVFLHNCRAIHAEQNLIIQASIYGVSLKGCTIYCTHQPCSICMKMLIGIKPDRIVYNNPYPDEESINMLEEVARSFGKHERYVVWDFFNWGQDENTH